MKNITRVGVATLTALSLVVAGSTAAQAATFVPEGDGSGTTITTSHGYTAKFPIGSQVPAGLTVDPATGVASGTPLSDGSFYVWSGSTLAAANKVYDLSTSVQVSGSASGKFDPLRPSATDFGVTQGGASGYTELYSFVTTPENLDLGVNGWAAYTFSPANAAPTATNIGMGQLGVTGSNNGGVAALFAGTGTKTAYVGVSLTSNSGVVPLVTWARQITINADADTYTFAGDQIIALVPPSLAAVQAVVDADTDLASTVAGTSVTVAGLTAATGYKAYVYTAGDARILIGDVTADGSGNAVVDVATALSKGLSYGQDAYLVFVQPDNVAELEGVSVFKLTGVLTAPTPTISGSPAVGSALTAKPGSWTSGTAFAYQWYSNGAAINGATKSTFTVTSSQVGKSLTVKVTGSKSGYATVSKTSPATAKVLGVATPTISGTAAVGSTLTAKPGTWTSGTTLSYQWYANGAAIKGATKSTFALTTSHAGKSVTVIVKGSKSGYAAVSKTSKATAKVLAVATPTISGTAKVGSKLTAKAGAWTSGTSFAYQWYANGTAIKGATKSTFTLTTSQVGKSMTVKVTGSKSGHATVSKTSKATPKVVKK